MMRITIINRYSLLFIILSTPFLIAKIPTKEIIIGTTAPLKEEGSLIQMGMTAFINATNEIGGLNDIPLKLIAYDDNKSRHTSIENIRKLLSQTHIFANVFSTGVINDLPSDITNEPLLIFGPDENSNNVQKPQFEYLIHTKPSTYRELETLIDYAVNTKQKKRIAIFFVDDETGKSERNDTRTILNKYNIKPIAEASHPRRTVEVEKAVALLADAHPETIICLSHRHATYNFIIQSLNARLFNSLFMGTSYLVPIQAQIKKQRGVDFVCTSVIPNPNDTTKQISNDYKRDYKKYYPEKPYDLISFDAYLNMAILADLMRKVSDPTDPRALINAAEELKDYQFKGLILNFDRLTRSLQSELWLITNIDEPWQLISQK